MDSIKNVNLTKNVEKTTTTNPTQLNQTKEQKHLLYLIPITNNFSFPHYRNNTKFYNDKALNALGVILEVDENEFISDPNGEYVLGDGWNCKWHKLHRTYVLKLKATNAEKKRLLDIGVVNYFVSKGLMKFYAVALVKAKVRYKIQLIETLVTIINNEGYLQAFRHHPVYNNVFNTQLSKRWVSSWCENVDLHNTGIFRDSSYPILFELVKMVKIIDQSEAYRQKLESKKKFQGMEIKVLVYDTDVSEKQDLSTV